MNPNAFQGTLHPNPSDLTMEVDRLIIREDSIVFDVHGMQDGERWNVESGQVDKEEGDYFYGSGYYEDGTRWRVWLLNVSRTEGECSIEGLWFDHDVDDPSGGWLWTFGGTLQPLEESK